MNKAGGLWAPFFLGATMEHFPARRSIAARAFWSILNTPEMGANLTVELVRRYAAEVLGETVTSEEADVVYYALRQWRVYDGHRLQDFLAFLIEKLNDL